ncbi:MAG: RluA family pseudouridine synthase [Bacteroidia bacterium]|nr:RluA family pseudouridine synthase [Bacteroidia bacterium]
MYRSLENNSFEHDDSSELYEHHRFEVDKGQATLRIDKYLSDRIGHVSRTKIQSAAQAGNILVDNCPVKSNYKVKPLEIISVVLPFPPRETEIIPQNIPVNIIYEDNDIIVVNKGAGMIVHPGYGNDNGTLVNALYWHLKDNPLFESGEIRAGLVHRLDKDTTGLMVVAKTEYALNHLAKQFFERAAGRRYIALIWGTFDIGSGTITGHIGRNLKDRRIMAVFPDGSYGKAAVTHYTVLEKLGYVSLLECKLETGRTHQIRAHLAYIRHPVFNDQVYGGSQIIKGTTFSKYKQFVDNCFKILPRQALHAKTISFIHPVTKKLMNFDSELPSDMQQVIDKWRNYITGRKNVFI